MAINQAAHVHDLTTIHKLTVEQIEKAIGLNRSILSSASLAYQKTLDYHDFCPDDKDWLNKYSYFYELVKKPNLKEWASEQKFRRVVNWIQSGQIQRGEEVRRIPDVMSDERMRKKVSSGGSFKDALNLGTKLKIRSKEEGKERPGEALAILLNTSRVVRKIRVSNSKGDRVDNHKEIDAARRLKAELTSFLKTSGQKKKSYAVKKVRKR